MDRKSIFPIHINKPDWRLYMYTIKQAAEKTKLSEYTIRYYDREGLLPQLKRSKNGNRQFSDDDLSWIQLICCLKNSGMPLQKIKDFLQLCLNGASTCEERKDLLLEHKALILQQMDVLNNSLNIINYKIDHYKEFGIFHIDQSIEDT